MMRVGIIGFGLMGHTHLNAWREQPGVEVCALCDKIFENGKPAEEIVGNINTATAVNIDGLELFTDCDKMLAEADLDAVSITLPTFLHCEFTLKALKAGVNVLCEKPMGLNLEECALMADTAKQEGKLLQIGHCIRFWPEYIKAKEIIDSGEYGKLVFGNFYRYSASPGWSGSSWFVDETRSGGMILDLHIHDTDFILHLLGMPKSVKCTCSTVNGIPNHVNTQYYYDNNAAITSEGSWAISPNFGFRMGFVIGLEKATLELNPAVTEGLQVSPFEEETFKPELPAGTGYVNQVAYFIKKINGEDIPEILTPQQSMQSIEVGLAERESAVSGKEISL